MKEGDQVIYLWQDMMVPATVIRVGRARTTIKIDLGRGVMYRIVRTEKLREVKEVAPA